MIGIAWVRNSLPAIFLIYETNRGGVSVFLRGDIISPMKLGWVLAASLLTSVSFAQRNVPRTYDLLDVKWEVRLDEKARSIQGDVTNTLTPLATLREVRFDSARLNIDEVTVNGKRARFRTSGDALFVTLGEPAQAGQKLAVRVRYHGKPEAGAYFVPAERAFPAKTPMAYTQGEMEDTRYWLPTYDFMDDKATSEGTIEVPQGWNVLSNGRLVEKSEANGRARYHWKTEQPHSTYLISFVAGPYSAIEDGEGDLPVEYWVPVGLEEQGKATFGGTERMIRFYESLTGVKYPYAKFAQSVVADYMFGGMENISAVTNTITALHSPKEEPLASGEGLVAHELAHQWFGDLVTGKDWSHIWINEGFATFLPHFLVRELHGQEAFDIGRMNTLRGAFGAMKGQNEPMVWNKYQDAIERFGGNSYGGGAARMFMLMRLVGEEPFWKGVHAFLEKYKFANATTEDFFAVMSSETGQNLDGFRKQWFYQAGVPTVTVKREGDAFVVSQDSDKFDLPIEYMVFDGPSPAKLEKATLGSRPLRIPAAEGALIQIDPECWSIAEVKYELGLDDKGWIEMFKKAPLAAQRLRLLGSVIAATTPEERVSLAKEEPNVDVQIELVRSLKDTGELVAYANQKDARIQLAAIETLGGTPKSDTSVELLTRVAKTEPNDILRLAAMKSLTQQEDSPKWVDEAYKIVGQGDSFRTWALEWWTAHDKDRAREMALGIVANPPTEPLRIQALRTLGQVKDKPGETKAFDALTRTLAEDSVGGVRTAASALGAYGDKRALPFLEKRKDHGLHFIRNEIRGIISGLSGS
jgi:aminopeptidase N